MKVIIKHVIYLIISVNFLYGQQANTEIFELLDVSIWNKNESTIIKNDSSLNALNLPSDVKRNIASKVDFKQSQLIYLSFNYTGPSMCKTYFEYFVSGKSYTDSLLIRIHDVGEKTAKLSKNTFLVIAKEKQFHKIKIDKKYVEYNFSNVNQLDSLCGVIAKKFKK